MNPEQAMEDLEDRLIRAAIAICEIGKTAPGAFYRERLLGKAEGIQLALSYLREYGGLRRQAVTGDSA